MGYLPPHTIDASAMAADAEDRLLAAVSSCSNHVLRPVFPPLGSGPDRTTSHFLIKTILISFLAYYTECSINKLFLCSRRLHYYVLYPFYISLTFSVVELRYVDRLFVNKTKTHYGPQIS